MTLTSENSCIRVLMGLLLKFLVENFEFHSKISCVIHKFGLFISGSVFIDNYFIQNIGCSEQCGHAQIAHKLFELMPKRKNWSV